jgi:hypothetical protein
MYAIRMGIPEMKALWENLIEREKAKTLSKDETTLYKKWGKALAYLARDPRYPGLQSHEIDALSRRYGVKVWQSYLENRTASAARMYWVYGPGKEEITIIGLEPHPEDKKSSGYAKVKLSATGKETEE